MAMAEIFRTCPDTGLKVHSQAEALIKANAVVAVVFLAVGGFFGLLVALTRWPAVHLLPADWFYLVLTAHGADVLLFWIVFFEMAILYFASAILLNSRLAAPRFAWLGFILMLVGAVLVSFVMTLPLLYVPFLQEVFHTYPLSLADWVIIITAAFTIFPILEIGKLAIRRLSKS